MGLILLLEGYGGEVQAELPYSWNVTEAVISDLDYSWKVLEDVTSDALDYSWGIGSMLESDPLSYSWNIMQAVTSSALDYSWTIRDPSLLGCDGREIFEFVSKKKIREFFYGD